MKRYSVYLIAALVGLLFMTATDASAQKKFKKLIVAAEDLKWEQLADAPPGVMVAQVKGDQTKGAYIAFTKFPAGFTAPLHYHTHDAKITVIKGGYTYNGKTYGPGSFLMIPGMDKHTSGGVADSETIFLDEATGKFDLHIVDAPKEQK